MITHEFYIDNRLMDVDDTMNFELVFKSAVFTDISKIASNRTSTVKLPKTANNLRNIDLAHRVDVRANFPYKSHKIDYYRNGFPIITNGKAVLFPITDKIEIGIFWGSIQNLLDILNKSIRELTITHLNWNNNTSWLSYKQVCGFLKMDYGLGIQMKYIQPCAQFKHLIDRLNSEFGIKVDIPIKDLDTIYIPCTERKADEKMSEYFNSQNVSTKIALTASGFRFEKINDPYAITNDNTNIFVAPVDGVYELGYDIRFSRMVSTLDDFTVSSGVYVNGSYHTRGKTELDDKGSGGTHSEKMIFFYDQSGVYAWWNPEELIVPYVKLYLKRGDVVTYHIIFKYDSQSATEDQNSGMILMNGASDIKIRLSEPSEVIYPGVFPLELNLPDVNFLDILKTAGLLMGQFFYVDYEDPNTIKSLGVDDMYNNKNKAVDWTNKLISIKETSFTFQDYAQKNWIKYKEDKDVLKNDDGFIVVENENIEKEKDIATLLFSNTENLGEYAQINAYSKDDKGAKFTKYTPRIIKAYQTDTEVKGYSGEEMSIQKRIDTYYRAHQAIIKKAKVINAEFQLNDLDIYNFDFKIPIFIQQVGQYYMSIEAKIDNNNVGSFMLLQMV